MPVGAAAQKLAEYAAMLMSGKLTKDEYGQLAADALDYSVIVSTINDTAEQIQLQKDYEAMKAVAIAVLSAIPA